MLSLFEHSDHPAPSHRGEDLPLRKDVKMLCPHCGWWNAAGVETGQTPKEFYCFRCGKNVTQAKHPATQGESSRPPKAPTAVGRVFQAPKLVPANDPRLELKRSRHAVSQRQVSFWSRLFRRKAKAIEPQPRSEGKNTQKSLSPPNSPVRPSTSAIPSSRGPRALNGSSECAEMFAMKSNSKYLTPASGRRTESTWRREKEQQQ